MLNEEKLEKGTIAQIIDGPLRGNKVTLTGEERIANNWGEAKVILGGLGMWIRKINLRPQ